MLRNNLNGSSGIQLKGPWGYLYFMGTLISVIKG